MLTEREGEKQEIEVGVSGHAKSIEENRPYHVLPLIDYSQLKNDQLHRCEAIWKSRFK